MFRKFLYSVLSAAALAAVGMPQAKAQLPDGLSVEEDTPENQVSPDTLSLDLEVTVEGTYVSRVFETTFVLADYSYADTIHSVQIDPPSIVF